MSFTIRPFRSFASSSNRPSASSDAFRGSRPPIAITVASIRRAWERWRGWSIDGHVSPDPSAPEVADELAWHEKQWEQIRQHRAQAGDNVFTFTPEYGPPGYLHTLPHTQAPVTDLWKVCLWAVERARQQWNQP